MLVTAINSFSDVKVVSIDSSSLCLDASNSLESVDSIQTVDSNSAIAFEPATDSVLSRSPDARTSQTRYVRLLSEK